MLLLVHLLVQRWVLEEVEGSAYVECGGDADGVDDAGGESAAHADGEGGGGGEDGESAAHADGADDADDADGENEECADDVGDVDDEGGESEECADGEHGVVMAVASTAPLSSNPQHRTYLVHLSKM